MGDRVVTELFHHGNVYIIACTIPVVLSSDECMEESLCRASVCVSIESEARMSSSKMGSGCLLSTYPRTSDMLATPKAYIHNQI
jgi:hypothetical protein